MTAAIENMEAKTFKEDDSPEVPPPDVVAYNELRSCADLYRMKKDEILKIRPEFQREVVWRPGDQTRFVDSLIKQLPIPSMCFSLDYKTQKWQVIDGLQRMSTICRFLNETDNQWILSELDDIEPKISGQAVASFHEKGNELHAYLRRVQNLTLPITVLRCDYSKLTHTRYLFTIFHRLNTGGVKLNNQEIRNCIYSGTLNDLLKELDKLDSWKKLLKVKSTEGRRFTKQELILRVFAFLENYENYGGRLAGFLNDYMATHRELAADEIDRKRKLFTRTVKLVLEKIYLFDPPAKLTVTVLESLLVGVAANIDQLEGFTSEHLRERLAQLNGHEEFSEAKLSEGLSGKPRVIGRIDAARSIFGV